LSDTPLYLSYVIVPDPTLPENTFRFTVTAPTGDPRAYTCNLFNSAGAEVWDMVTIGGTTDSSPNPFDPFPGDTITAHLNVRGSGLPDTVVPLVFPAGVAAALNQQKIWFTWSTRTVPVETGATKPLAALDPSGTPVVLSYDVPEPTVYRGRQIIELNFPSNVFVTQDQVVARSMRATAGASAAASTAALVPGIVPGLAPSPMNDFRPGYTDDVLLYGGTAPETRATGTQLSDSRIGSAFTVARTTGYFDPAVFPNVSAGNDRFSRDMAIQALTDLDVPTVTTQLNAGNRLALYRDASGRCTYRFIPVPVTGVPRLLIVETYRLSSFPARYGAGRTIKTFSLLPGEHTTIRVSSYKRSTESMARSSSILDSTSDETESEFERSVLSEQSRQDDTSRAFEYYAEASAEAKGNWGWASASVSVTGGVKGASTASRQEFAKNVSNAVSHNAARASSRRDVQIDTSMDVKIETGEEQAIERELSNVNVSRTLNFVFRQMNQEFVTLLHLVDIRIAFFNGFAESRYEVPLPELDQLLSTYIVPDQQAAVRDAILTELGSIMDYTGTVRNDFVETVTLTGDDGGAAAYQRVNPEVISQYRAGADGPIITVPGVIMAADAHVMRTDGVVVDTFLGLGNGLDDYSIGLQQQAVRGQQVDNDRQQVDNDYRAAEVDRLRLALSIIESGNGTAADLYQRLFPVPQIINQIDHAAINSPLGAPTQTPNGKAAAAAAAAPAGSTRAARASRATTTAAE
jgi:hypothetical protein